jgi:hypothetical protein
VTCCVEYERQSGDECVGAPRETHHPRKSNRRVSFRTIYPTSFCRIGNFVAIGESRKLSPSLCCRGRWNVPNRFEFFLGAASKGKAWRTAATKPTCREILNVQRIDRNGAFMASMVLSFRRRHILWTILPVVGLAVCTDPLGPMDPCDLPDRLFAAFRVQPRRKKFRAFLVGQITFTNSPVPSLKRGGSRSSRNARRDAVDADSAFDEWRHRGRRSRVVLMPRRWHQVLEKQASQG